MLHIFVRAIDAFGRIAGFQIQCCEQHAEIAREQFARELPDFTHRVDVEECKGPGCETCKHMLRDSADTLLSALQTLELLINGRGHGHGVGLCQWGARGQAVEGRTCEQILSYYYPGATVVTRSWR